MDGKKYSFDDRGDLNSGYDVILWKQTSTHVDVHHIIAHYSIENQKLNLISQTLQSVIVRISLLFYSFVIYLSLLYFYSMHPHSLQSTLAASLYGWRCQSVQLFDVTVGCIAVNFLKKILF